MHKLTRLINSLHREPMLILQEDLEGITSYLKDRSMDGLISDYEMAIATSGRLESKKPPKIENGFAFLDIHGSISHLSTDFQAWCGMTSYQTILQDMDDIVADGSVHTIVMDVDSGGGAAKFCFETARRIRQLADENDIKLIAYTETVAASAAFALPAVAHEFISTKDAHIGSIGVITQLVNYKDKLDEDGIKVETFKSGKFKDTGNPTRDMTQEERDNIQASIDELADEFFEHVAEYRGIDKESIIALEADVFRADKALEFGLIDKIMNPFEFQEYLQNLSEDSPQSMGIFSKKLEDNNTGDDMSLETQEMQEKLEALEAELAASQEEKEATLSLVQEQEAKLEKAMALVKEKEEAEKQMKLDALKADAEAWSVFGVDAESYATFAMDAAPEFVANMKAALNKANELLDANMEQELGVEVEGDGVEEPTEKSLTAQKIKEQNKA